MVHAGLGAPALDYLVFVSFYLFVHNEDVPRTLDITDCQGRNSYDAACNEM